MTQVARALADLKWLLLSPGLLADQAATPYSRPNEPLLIQQFSASERAAIEHWLAQIEVSETLSSSIAQPGQQRLGRYAERLLRFYLSEGPLHRLLATNLALRSSAPGRQTIGEIDALLADPAGGKWHWELAVKFFLCISHSSCARTDEFIGPNRRDSLDRKIDKLLGRQLQQPPPVPWDQFHWQRAALVRGMIFYRYGRPISRCDSLSPDHNRGWWIPRDALDELPDQAYAHVPRLNWMVPLPLASPEAVLANRAAVHACLDQVQRLTPARYAPGESAEMLVRLRPAEDGWQEQDRGFVVSWNDAAQ